jgi:hypothetical protein
VQTAQHGLPTTQEIAMHDFSTLNIQPDACNPRIAGVPRSHLTMHKIVVNQVMLAMGLEQSQQMATVFDGITRHNPEGLWFRRYAQEQGFKAGVQWRDGGESIPEGNEARALVREMYARRTASGDAPSRFRGAAWMAAEREARAPSLCISLPLLRRSPECKAHGN